MYVRSPLNYWGSKFKILGQLKNIFPKKIENLYDVFGGSGSVSWNIKANQNFYNEFNKDIYLVNKWLFENDFEFIKNEVEKTLEKWNLVNQPIKTQIVCKKTNDLKSLEFAKEQLFFYKKFLDHSLEFEKTNPLYIYIWWSLCAFYKSEEFKKNNTRGTKTINFIKLKIWKDYLKNRKIEFYNLDCFEFLKKFEFKENDFIYLDPPYISTTTEFYGNEIYGLNKQNELLNFLDELTSKNIKWAFSNVDNEILDNWLINKNYTKNILEISYTYGTNSYNYENKKHQEILITNYQNEKVSYKWEQLTLF